MTRRGFFAACAVSLLAACSGVEKKPKRRTSHSKKVHKRVKEHAKHMHRHGGHPHGGGSHHHHAHPHPHLSGQGGHHHPY